MSKKVKIITVIAALLLTALFVLTACDPYKWGPLEGASPEAEVSSNGGLAVRQGNYIYFVNGKLGFPTAETGTDTAAAEGTETDINSNEFGKAVKGAIVRVPVDANGAVDEKNYQIVVPKNVMTDNASGGFSIYGEWLYYVSPTTDTDVNNKLMSEELDYFRVKTDGTGTQRIARLTGKSLEYKFTPTGLIYVDPTPATNTSGTSGATLKTVTYTATGLGETKTITENVQTKIFPVSATYKPGETYAADYVFYTKKHAEDSRYPGYELFAATGEGTERPIIKITDFTGGKEPSEDVMDKLYQPALKHYLATEDGGIELYYDKAYQAAIGGAQTYLGIHGLKIDKNLSADLTKEVRFTNPSDSAESNTWFPLGLEKGVLIFKSPNATLEKPKVGGTGETDKDTYKGLSGVTLLKIIKEGDYEYMYYLSGAKIMRDRLIPDPDENARQISEATVETAWFTVDYLDGYFYYVNTSAAKASYLSRVKAGAPENIDKETGLPKDQPIALRTEADQTAWDKANA